MMNPESPPPLSVSRWFGTKEPITLEGLKGRVVVIEAFQMLCPGCVEHGLPLAKKIAERFNPAEVVVLGLHCVFEHHKVMTPEALEAFLHEYRLPFPVGFDEPDEKLRVPKTMRAYEIQGTPTMLLFDRGGRLRRHYFGKPDEMTIAAEITAMASEGREGKREHAILVEQMLASVLKQPEEGQHHHHHHDHEHGDACGCGHDHGDGHHHHDHGHVHGHHHHGAAKS